jgi:DnaJ-class molecular chaperone
LSWIDTFSQWRANKREQRLARHRERNTCPDCGGRGYMAVAYSDVVLFGSPDDLSCPGCGGSGTYEAWAATSPE